jgi:prepilin-type N-terminal cleavage/methylation domain-containing protein
MSTARQRGFSLVELMVSVAILSIVIGVVLDGVSTMQKRNTVEVNKVDLTQESREFMDQIVNDLHQAGYPSLKMFDPATLTSPQSPTDCTLDPNLACGFISVSSNFIQFEGDVDGTGVSEVIIKLSTGGCPCTLQRGTISKASYMLGNLPPYYTQVDNVMNSSVFTAYQYDGSLATMPADHAHLNLSPIAAIGITLFVKSKQQDLQTGQYPMVTMVATAKMSNVQSLL